MKLTPRDHVTNHIPRASSRQIEAAVFVYDNLVTCFSVIFLIFYNLYQTAFTTIRLALLFNFFVCAA